MSERVVIVALFMALFFMVVLVWTIQYLEAR
jgi:hypothetical protein